MAPFTTHPYKHAKTQTPQQVRFLGICLLYGNHHCVPDVLGTDGHKHRGQWSLPLTGSKCLCRCHAGSIRMRRFCETTGFTSCRHDRRGISRIQVNRASSFSIFRSFGRYETTQRICPSPRWKTLTTENTCSSWPIRAERLTHSVLSVDEMARRTGPTFGLTPATSSKKRKRWPRQNAGASDRSKRGRCLMRWTTALPLGRAHTIGD